MKRLFILSIIVLLLSQICQATLVDTTSNLDNWMSPISVFDAESLWTGDNNIIDGNLTTSAYYLIGSKDWHGDIRFSFPETNCDKFRVYARGTTNNNQEIRGRAYWEGVWHDWYTFAISITPGWYEFSLDGIKSVSQIQLNLRRINSADVSLYEVEYNVIPEPATIVILSLGILVLIPKKK